MIRVLYISYDGMTDNLGQSQVIPYLKGLSKLGYSFTLLSCEKPENYTKNKTLIQEILNESNIDWRPVVYHKSPPVLSSVFDIYQIKTKAISLHKVLNFDIVHCRSYLPSLIGLMLKTKHGVKFIFDMRGFWADERIDGNLWNIKNPIYNYIYKFFKRKEKEFIEHSDVIISLTEAGKIEMQSWKVSPAASEKIMVIPCCVDMLLFNKKRVDLQDISDLKFKLDINNNEFVLSYLGSIGTWYMLDEMLDFFLCLLEKKKDTKFLFISPESEHKYIREAASKKQLDSKSIITVESARNEVPKYLALSTCSIFFIKPSYSKKSSSPTKQAEIMAMGIPLICNSNVGDVEEILLKNRAGFIVKNFNNKSYIDIINKIDSHIFDTHKIEASTNESFSLEKGIALYSKVYRKLLSSS